MNGCLRNVCTKTKHEVDASEWYEKFASMGLCYGPLFRGLFHIEAPSNTKYASARLSLRPHSGFDGEESRYIIHPAVFDAFLQLSIIAPHSGKAHRLRRKYLPVSFERVIVRRPCLEDFQVPVRLISAGSVSGVRGLTADLQMTDANDKVLVDIENAQLLASDQGSLSLPEDVFTESQNLPYTRLVWSPDFDLLTTGAVMKLYPPKILDETAVAPLLNKLALLQLIAFQQNCPQLFSSGSDKPHLQNLLDWILRKIELAKQNHYPQSQKMTENTPEGLTEQISTLSEKLNKVSPESRTMCQIYRNLELIFRGDKTGIQVALENNSLYEMYENGQIIKEGNRRLASLVELLSRRQPYLRILEIGAGTGSATREILAALKGQSIYRQYKEYVFTDITPSFLSSAKEKLVKYHGVKYETYDMQKMATDEGLEEKFDLVVASNVRPRTPKMEAVEHSVPADYLTRLFMHLQTSCSPCETYVLS